MTELAHLNPRGEAHMVDISGKAETARTAVAVARVQLTAVIVTALRSDTLPKGDLYATVRIATIQASKRCSDLIPPVPPTVAGEGDSGYRPRPRRLPPQ